MHEDARRNNPSAGAEDVANAALQYLDNLFATARRLTRDRAAAEDLVQETFLKAVRSAHRFEPGTNLRAWLFTILHNTFRNDRRDAGRDPVEVDSDTVGSLADLRAGVASPEQALLEQATAAELRAALDELPDAYRQAVWLRDVEDLSYAQIADVLDIPIGTVMSRLARGRRLLHQRLMEQRQPPARSARREEGALPTSGARREGQ